MRQITVFTTLLLVDVIIVILHLRFGTQNHFFHLDYEANLPTLYQSLKLIIFSLIFFFFTLRGSIKREIKPFLIPLSLFMLALGLDELFQIHENIYRIFEFLPWMHPSKIVDASMKMGYRSSLWILYYIPAISLFLFWSGYWLRFFESKMKSNFWIIGISSICLFVVLLMEILGSTGTYSEPVYFWMVTLEESAEMLFASTLILVASKVLSKYGNLVD